MDKKPGLENRTRTHMSLYPKTNPLSAASGAAKLITPDSGLIMKGAGPWIRSSPQTEPDPVQVHDVSHRASLI